MANSTPYDMPKEPARFRAMLLALLVHLLLFGLLWFGIRWQSETPIAIEAEVWSLQPREAAPLPQPTPVPEVKPEQEPKPPEPKPVVKEPPKPPVAEQKIDTPDIALEQEKKRKEKERLEQQRIDTARLEKERLEKARIEKERLEKARIEKERQEKLAAARKKAEAEELKKKLAAEKLRKERQEAEEQLAAERRHQENLARMTAQAGTPGTGSAPRSQGARADSDYLGRVAAKIKSNTIFNVPDMLSGNPPVEYEVQLLPDGSLRSVRKIRSSGVPGFDEAVARAIERSAPFPHDKTGTVPGVFNVIHRPKDQ